MLDLIYAAETQFRLDSDRRGRDLIHLAALRERAAFRPAQAVAAPALPMRSARTWPRPIGVAHPQPA